MTRIRASDQTTMPSHTMAVKTISTQRCVILSLNNGHFCNLMHCESKREKNTNVFITDHLRVCVLLKEILWSTEMATKMAKFNTIIPLIHIFQTLPSQGTSLFRNTQWDYQTTSSFYKISYRWVNRMRYCSSRPTEQNLLRLFSRKFK